MQLLEDKADVLVPKVGLTLVAEAVDVDLVDSDPSHELFERNNPTAFGCA